MAAQSRDHRKGKKNRRTIGKSTGKDATLSWKPVQLPVEAVASGGQSDADFFQGLDFEDDDYMGIKEVEGVEVVKKKDGSIALMPVGNFKPPFTSKRGQKRPLISESELEVESLQDESTEASAEEIEEFELSDIVFPEENGNGDVSSGESNTIESEDEHQADFRLLMKNDDDEKQDEGTWSRKSYNAMLPHWAKLKIDLHANLKSSLHKLSFTKPTTIQKLTLPHTMSAEKRDVVGIAQTGSGKTLAYGLPILNWICETTIEDRQMTFMDSIDEEEEGTRLAALILIPTRELALQVTKHLEDMITSSSTDMNSKWASIATLTGGISEEKQRRLLNGFKGRGADILVATPGRLWDMCKGDDMLARRIKLTRFLVVDEADRMIETGHFAEMESILALVKRSDDSVGTNFTKTTAIIAGGAADMQTFIFSATLSKDLQRNLKRSNHRKRRRNSASTLEDLIEMIDFRDEDPKLIDLSTKTRLTSGLVETKLECLSSDKDIYLYYFLLRYPGRTLIFVNSIDGIRRLQPLLENLKFSVQPLHSQLQQRQRLKNLDRFKSSLLPSIQASNILLATDVAARGLDISAVDHVVHFQLPRAADTYVHRSGRTARAGQSGISLALIEPSEKKLWRDLNKSLSRTDEIAIFPVEYSFLPELKIRVKLAKEVDKLSHTERKAAHDDAWIRKLASEAEMDISEDEDEVDSEKLGKVNKKHLAAKMKLEQSLQKSLSARGVSFRYITSGSRDFIHSLLNDEQHGQMIGVQKSTLQDDLADQSPKSSKRKRVLD